MHPGSMDFLGKATVATSHFTEGETLDIGSEVDASWMTRLETSEVLPAQRRQPADVSSSKRITVLKPQPTNARQTVVLVESVQPTESHTLPSLTNASSPAAVVHITEASVSDNEVATEALITKSTKRKWPKPSQPATPQTFVPDGITTAAADHRRYMAEKHVLEMDLLRSNLAVSKAQLEAATAQIDAAKAQKQYYTLLIKESSQK